MEEYKATLKNKRSPLAATLVIIVMLAAVVIGGPLYLKSRFPAPQGPKPMTYKWSYQGRVYSLSLTLYRSYYNYYHHRLKGVFLGREDESIARYLAVPAKDKTIKELAAALKKAAAAAGLNEDQTLELAVAFVQSIPYDVVKAGTDLKHPRYAYEVLYENKGICTGKSFLMYEIIRHLGYGAAIFAYPKEKHMNVGVETEKRYSTDNSGYAMVETTNPKVKIGVIPSLDTASRQALGKRSLPRYNLKNPNSTLGTDLSTPDIYARRRGKKYNGVIQVYQAEREIAAIKSYLTSRRPLIKQKEAEITDLERRMVTFKAAGDVRAYNALVTPHNKLVTELKSMINEYNAKVNRYNFLVRKTFT